VCFVLLLKQTVIIFSNRGQEHLACSLQSLLWHEQPASEVRNKRASRRDVKCGCSPDSEVNHLNSTQDTRYAGQDSVAALLCPSPWCISTLASCSEGPAYRILGPLINNLRGPLHVVLILPGRFRCVTDLN
jgi:hypothetical protein